MKAVWSSASQMQSCNTYIILFPWERLDAISGLFTEEEAWFKPVHSKYATHKIRSQRPCLLSLFVNTEVGAYLRCKTMMALL